MKKKLMLVILTIAIGAIPIVANAEENNSEAEPYVTYLHDVNEDGEITYIDVLDYVTLTTIPKYEEGSKEAQYLWSVHEEVKRMSEPKAEVILNNIIINY